MRRDFRHPVGLPPASHIPSKQQCRPTISSDSNCFLHLILQTLSLFSEGQPIKLFAHINQPPHHSGPATSSFLMWNLSVLVQASKSGPLRKKDTLLKYSNSLNYRRATQPGTSRGTNSRAGAPGQLGACGGTTSHERAPLCSCRRRNEPGSQGKVQGQRQDGGC